MFVWYIFTRCKMKTKSHPFSSSYHLHQSIWTHNRTCAICEYTPLEVWFPLAFCLRLEWWELEKNDELKHSYYSNNIIIVLMSITLQVNSGIYNVNEKGQWAWTILYWIPETLFQRRSQLYKFWNEKMSKNFQCNFNLLHSEV